MSNIVKFPSKPSEAQLHWDCFDEQLSYLARHRKKNVLNVAPCWVKISSALSDLAIDAMTIEDDQPYFASTVEGAYALCSVFFVYDLPQLSNLAPYFVDGHAVFISKDELTRRIHNEDLVDFLRSGAKACGECALNQTPTTSWQCLERDTIKKIMQDVRLSEEFFEVWHSDVKQDAWRFASAIKKMAIPSIRPSYVNAIEETVLTGGFANQAWGDALRGWDRINNNASWQKHNIKKNGVGQIGTMISELIPYLRSDLLQQRFVHLLCYKLELKKIEDINVAQIIVKNFVETATIDHSFVIDSLVSLMSSCDTNERQNKNYEHNDVIKEVHQLYFLAQWMEKRHINDRVLCLSVFLNRRPHFEHASLREFFKSEVTKHNYTDKQLVLLTQYQPSVIKDLINHHQVSPNVFEKALKCRPTIDDEIDDYDKSLDLYIETIQCLISAGWADNELAMNKEKIEDICYTILFELDFKNTSATIQHIRGVIDAVGDKNPLFASQLFSVILNKDVAVAGSKAISPVLEKFVDQIDWSYNFFSYTCGDDATIAQAVMKDTDVSFKIKALANRHLRHSSEKGYSGVSLNQ